MRFVLLLLILLACAPPPAAMARDVDRAEVLRKINVAGRQRMLSQRIVMTACLENAGADAPLNRTKGEGAEALFQHSQAALRAGADDLRLGPETDARVIEALAKVEAYWPKYLAAVEEVRAADPGASTTRLRAAARKMLGLTEDVVESLGTAYDDGAGVSAMATTVNIAGRQRMLIQKTMMEACFAAVGGHGAALSRRVGASKTLFERSLANLMIGDARQGILPPPTAEIDAKLITVVRIWRWLGADFTQLAEGVPVTAERLGQLARASEIVLVTMNQSVTLYEAQ
ncbi:type IV pili methyl-accepting chemotaxis transducer N-terminal domain-containing protein [Pseudooceanicola sp. LIPI14-2-Ac024]|uniref:type IV pili methyl-accepting chemotaxis transducer N-terminal domain-containing protein n=1 Tax=Pseudooceanicola sp. LIPI14-2-Ac024 TaxID=3344875 RepID=UPI0035CF1631